MSGPSGSPVPAAGGHGGDGAAVARALGLDPADMLDLSASMNPAAADPMPILRRHLERGIRAYPDPARAEAALAETMGVDPDRLLLTHGGAEAISLLAARIGGHTVEPDFALYPRSVTGAGPRWRSNPHSPSGMLAPPEAVAGVWDEAFYPLATGTWTRGDGRVPVVGSLTKLLGVPGLRAGYLLADPQLVAQCRAAQPAWSVGGLAATALPDLLATVDLPATARRIDELRAEMRALLAAHGLRARDTDVNWVLVEHPGLREALAPHGVLVRDCASFGLPAIARIAVPDAPGLARLDTALSQLALPQPTEGDR